MSREYADKIEKIEKVSDSARTADGGIDQVQDLERLPPNKDHFDSLVSNGQDNQKSSTLTTVEDRVDPVTKSSLMDEVRNLNMRVDRFSKVHPKDLVAQADEVVRQMETIKTKLQTPELEIKPATQTMLQNKLSHIDENLRVALSKAGVEYTPPVQLDKTVNPIERFLGFLTHGQSQLAGLSAEINQMHLNNKEISPANMLRIQMKVGYITQEVEFFTAVLNKALESTKTIMNVQV